MTYHGLSPNVLLCGGGTTPRVDAVNMDTLDVHTPMVFQKNHTPYGIGIGPDGASAVAATKGGHIHLLSLVPPTMGARTRNGPLLERRDSALAACISPDGGIVIGELNGACVWCSDASGTPIVNALDTDGETICAFAPVGEAVYALTASGLLYCYELPNREPTAVLCATPPGPKLGLVNLLSLDEQTLAYPDAHGHLVVCDLPAEDVRRVAAHDKAFYAITVVPEGIVTAGYKECKVCLWDCSSLELNATFQAPEPAQAAAGLWGLDSGVLLVHCDGRAAVYDLASDKLVLRRALDGEEFRTAQMPVLPRLQRYRHAVRAEALTRLAQEFADDIAHLGTKERDAYRERFRELDGVHLYLGLLAQEAMVSRADDPTQLVEELRLRAEQARMLHDVPQSVPALAAYAAALEASWLWAAACDVYKRIEDIAPDLAYRSRQERAREMRHTIQRPQTVNHLGPEYPLPMLSEAATVADQRLIGRFVWSKAPMRAKAAAPISAETWATMYEQYCRDHHRTDLPHAHIEQTVWISGTRAEEVAAIRIPLSDPVPEGVISVWAPASGTASEHFAAVVVDADLIGTESDARGHASTLRALLAEPTNLEGIALRDVLKVLEDAYGMALNRAKAAAYA